MIDSDSDELLLRLTEGDTSALNALLDRYRRRLKNLISLRLDRRVAGRIDPSDVVQETLTTASQRIQQYVAERPMPFYPWLRQLAMDRLVEAHRKHIQAYKRSVVREQEANADQTSVPLANILASVAPPSASLRRQEEIEKVQSAIEQLSHNDRDVLVLRYLEQLTTSEMAAVLGISENTAAQRHLRTLRRVRAILIQK